jgi:hypothetical protein
MNLLASLRNRIFLASGLLAVLCIAVAIYLVNGRVTQEAERTIDREMVATAALVDSLRATRTETFTLMARFIADAPKLKAAVDTNDPPTVEDIVKGYQLQVKSNLLLVTNKTAGAGDDRRAGADGEHHLESAGRADASRTREPQLAAATDRDAPSGHGAGGRRADAPGHSGTVSVGFMLDNALAAQLKEITLSDVA